ncbi:hypothetical protein SAMN05444380_10476 [Thermophagus xiamenensis]|uniref:Uncharacterized protein n=1 Tax=Thermophagus xiamenensis TaxID=385682 RepID=A0A1I1WF49_9BACT|nr:hypothetical protein SAMN05444380_10476 [Thermophagus xiamenensis]
MNFLILGAIIMVLRYTMMNSIMIHIYNVLWAYYRVNLAQPPPFKQHNSL